MRDFVTGVLLLVVGALVALALGIVAITYSDPAQGQPGNPSQPYGSAAGEKQRAIEFDKDGDHVGVNLKKLPTPIGTPTPIAAGRCGIKCTNGFQIAVNGGLWSPLTTSSGGCVCPGTGTASTAVGSSSVASNTGSMGLGQSSSSTGTNSVAVGFSSSVSGNFSVGVGTGAVASADNDVAVGQGATATSNDCVAVGAGATCTAAAAVVLGSTNALHDPVNVFFGNAQSQPTPAEVTLQPAAASGTNVAGRDVTLRGGRSTGTGAGGSINFATTTSVGSGSSLGTITKRWTIDGVTGNFVPIADNTYDIGSLSKRAGSIFGKNVLATQLGIWTGGGTLTDPFTIGILTENDITLSGAVGVYGALASINNITYDADVGSTILFANVSTYTNTPGVARHLPVIAPFYEGGNYNFDATASMLIDNYWTVNGGPTFSRAAGGGTVTFDKGWLLEFNPTIGAGVHFNELYGLEVHDPTGPGTVDEMVGVEIHRFTHGNKTSLGVANADTTSNASLAQNLTAVGNAVAVAHATYVEITSTGSLTLSSTPMVVNALTDGPIDGQYIEITDVDSTDCVTFSDQGTVAGSGLMLAATTRQLCKGDTLKLRYSVALSRWHEVGFVNVL